MKKRRILWAVVLGSVLAITGCGGNGDDGGGSSGSGGSAGAGGSAGSGGVGGAGAGNICDMFCADCGAATESCLSQCASIIGDVDRVDTSVCSDEIAAYRMCVQDNECQGLLFNCIEALSQWQQCLVEQAL